jgi:CheY-like chemotaxis protein
MKGPITLGDYSMNGYSEESPKKESIKNILVVDDEKVICDLFKEGLEKFGYEVVVASNGNEGMRSFREKPADLIITDIFMPEKDGHTFIHEVMQEFPETKIFAITGKKSFEPEPDIDLNIAKVLGAIRVFAKPLKINELLAAIKELSE